MLPAEDDPEGEQHRVEDALPDVSKKQHPSPVEANGEPLHWDVDECHGDTQSEDYPEGAKTILIFQTVSYFTNIIYHNTYNSEKERKREREREREKSFTQRQSMSYSRASSDAGSLDLRTLLIRLSIQLQALCPH